MTSSYYQNQVASIEKEIAELYRKIADESRKENDKNRQIESVNKSINKNTSLSTLQNKQRQIQGYQGEISTIKKKIADFQKKVADKTSELSKKKYELRNAEERELKKRQKEQLDFQKRLERDIQIQKEQLDLLINQDYNSPKLNQTIMTQQAQKRYDFFISHASEDKDDIVRELAELLRKNDFEVWYDEFELKIGDSLRRKIDFGLSNSNFGIVIISPFFVKKNWTEYELNGMIAREMNGHKVVLPIWHKITKDEVLRFSPSLADKMALNTSIHSIEEIVDRLKEL